MMAFHCDRQGCERWEKTGHDEKFLVVDLPGGGCPHENQRHFCSFDCLMHWAAAQPAVVV